MSGGGGGGGSIFEICNQFFLRKNAFQTIVFIAFCDENNFFMVILKNINAYLGKNNSCVFMHMEKSHLNENKFTLYINHMQDGGG